MQDKTVYRRNNRFIINTDKVKDLEGKDKVLLTLYATIYSEFFGAQYSKKYKNFNSIQKLEKINTFAEEWLEERGFLK